MQQPPMFAADVLLETRARPRSISGQPNRRSTSSIFATGIVWPPTVQRVSDDRSKASRSGWESTYMYIVGTPSNIVAR